MGSIHLCPLWNLRDSLPAGLPELPQKTTDPLPWWAPAPGSIESQDPAPAREDGPDRRLLNTRDTERASRAISHPTDPICL